MKAFRYVILPLGFLLGACSTSPHQTPSATINQGIAMDFVKSYPATSEQAERFAKLDFKTTPSYLAPMDAVTTYELNIVPSKYTSLYFSLPAQPINFALGPADQKKFEQLVAEVLMKRSTKFNSH